MAINKGTQLASAGGNIPRGYAAGSMQKYTPEQLDLFKSLFSQVGPQSQLSQQASGQGAGFEPYEEAGRRAFQEYSGQLGSRYSGMGLGSRRGSAFKNEASQSAQDFALQLAGQRQDLQRQALQDLMQHSQMLLGLEPNEQFLVEKGQKPSFWKTLGKGAVGAAAGAGGGALAGSAIPGLGTAAGALYGGIAGFGKGIAS